MTSNIATVWAFRGTTLLNLILAGKAGGVISSGSRGCSNWEVVEPRLGGVWGRQAEEYTPGIGKQSYRRQPSVCNS